MVSQNTDQLEGQLPKRTQGSRKHQDQAEGTENRKHGMIPTEGTIRKQEVGSSGKRISLKE